jgi:hypothetical protein
MEMKTMKKQNPNDLNEIKMSEDLKQPIVTNNKFFKKQTVGFLSLAYAISLFTQNILFGISGSPGYNDPIDKVLTYHAENQGALSITSGLEAVNMVLLLFFITALIGLVKRRGDQGEDWTRLAIAAGSTLSALFALTIATHIAVILAASRLTESNIAFEIMWQFHAATFALSLPALGLTIIGTVLATHANGLTRPWHRTFGLLIGILPILAGLGSLAIAGGSSILYLGVIGLFLWIVWLIIFGLRLIRG